MSDSSLKPHNLIPVTEVMPAIPTPQGLGSRKFCSLMNGIIRNTFLRIWINIAGKWYNVENFAPYVEEFICIRVELQPNVIIIPYNAEFRLTAGNNPEQFLECFRVGGNITCN